MQKVHELLHPMVMVTQAVCGERRCAGSIEGRSSTDRVSSRISVTGPHSAAWSSRSTTRWVLWVPKTTSTQSARARMVSPSFCAMHPPTAICMPARSDLRERNAPR